MSIKLYKLKQPLLGWSKGEIISYEPEWNEWQRKRTGESFDYRGSVSEGEVAMLLSFLVERKVRTILDEATDLANEPPSSKQASKKKSTEPQEGIGK